MCATRCSEDPRALHGDRHAHRGDDQVREQRLTRGEAEPDQRHWERLQGAGRQRLRDRGRDRTRRPNQRAVPTQRSRLGRVMLRQRRLGHHRCRGGSRVRTTAAQRGRRGERPPTRAADRTDGRPRRPRRGPGRRPRTRVQIRN